MARPGSSRFSLTMPVGMVDGYRESAQSWAELLLDLKRRGLRTGLELAVGDGALGLPQRLPLLDVSL